MVKYYFFSCLILSVLKKDKTIFWMQNSILHILLFYWHIGLLKLPALVLWCRERPIMNPLSFTCPIDPAVEYPISWRGFCSAYLAFYAQSFWLIFQLHRRNTFRKVFEGRDVFIMWERNSLKDKREGMPPLLPANTFCCWKKCRIPECSLHG